MKVSHMLAALGLTLATIGAGAPAEAQRYDRGDYYGRHDDDRGYGRHDRGNHFGRDRDWRRHGYGRGDWRRHGYGNRGRDRCWTEWRRNHRVRVCR